MNSCRVNKHTISSPFEELPSFMETDKNQPNNFNAFNEYLWINPNVKNDDILCNQSLPSMYPISLINTQDYSVFDNLMQSYNNSNECYLNPKDWLVIDSISRRPRAPRQNEFLYCLLEHPNYSSYLTWLNKNDGLFKIHDPEKVAQLWSQVKNRRTHGIMNYDKFARGLRFYYKTGLMVKTHKKHTFRFKLPLRVLS